jgi:hypothetical protein
MPASELINLNHLIEDVGSLLPASMVENAVLAYDLASDLPLIEGDYRLVRRLFLNLLSGVKGMISLRTRLTQSDRASLTDNFPGAKLPEGQCVMVQVTELDSDTDKQVWIRLDLSLSFAACGHGNNAERTRSEPAETSEAQLVRRHFDTEYHPEAVASLSRERH